MENSQKVVVITGGSKGIGRAVAFKFAEIDAKIIIVYHADDVASSDTLKMLSQKGIEAESHKIDVSNLADVQDLFKEILSKYGKVDVLINNAGITRDNLFVRMSEDEWDMVMQVNLKSVYNCTRTIVRSMIKRRGGRIISVSSVVGQMGNAGQANYAASKAGIIGLTKSLAREVAGRGITVNAVAPGFIDTEMTAVLSDKVKESMLRQIPMGRIGSPEDIAETVYWLSSDAAGYITGQVIHVNGGMYLG